MKQRFESVQVSITVVVRKEEKIVWSQGRTEDGAIRAAAG